MRRPILIAAVLVLAAAAWLGSGQIDGARHGAPAPDQAAAPAAAPPLQAVRVRRLTAHTHVGRLIVNGRTEASRSVRLRAEVDGRVVSLAAREGGAVRRGAVIVRLSKDDREARLAEAEAILRQRTMEYDAGRKLFKKGFRADTKLAEAKALRDGARALVERTRLELARTSIAAPFDGVLHRRHVDDGAYVRAGDDIATIVDLDPVLVVAYLSEREVASVSVGTEGDARLADGTRISGRVRYVAVVADPATRTFRVELQAANPDGRVRDGLTSELRLPLPAVDAHRLTPALLSLDESGRIGIKVLGPENRVAFMPVEIIRDSQEGVWVTGLPPLISVISVGHEFVRAGEQVKPVFEADGVSG